MRVRSRSSAPSVRKQGGPIGVKHEDGCIAMGIVPACCCQSAIRGAALPRWRTGDYVSDAVDEILDDLHANLGDSLEVHLNYLLAKRPGNEIVDTGIE